MMKRYFPILFFLALFSTMIAAHPGQEIPGKSQDDYQAYFEEAYQLFPDVPRGVLEAVAFTQTRIRHANPDLEAPSCIGLPKAYGVMGLVEDGQGYFRNSLLTVAQWSGYTQEQIKNSPRINILAYAKAFHLMQQMVDSRDPMKVDYWKGNICWLSELPDGKSGGDDYALNVHLYSVLNFMNTPTYQKQYHFPQYQFDLPAIFGRENYKVLSAKQVLISANKTMSGDGTNWDPNQSAAWSPDYPPAIWDPAPSCNWSSRNGTPVSAVTIHTVQGSYAGAIAWFKNCNSNVAAHYTIRTSDGQVTQQVLESDKGWHVGSENPYTIGIEHEGYVSDPAWYTNILYQSSADLVRDILNSGYGIDGLKTYFGPPSTGLQTLSLNCYKIKGHQHYPNQTHVDPGINWDWDRYYRMLNDAPTPTTYTACSGTFHDPGGAGSNYPDQIRETWVIQPTNAQSTTLSFSSFDLETGYDYLYIYDGTDHTGDYLGRFDGSTPPGPFTSISGSFFLEFRTDCATTRAGWTGSWACSTNPVACGTPDGLGLSNLNGMGATLDWNSVSGATSYEIRVRNSLETSWTTYTTTSTNYTVTGLKAQSLYYWQVRSLCGAGQSSWAGDQFNTPIPGNHTATLCSGNFFDSGSDYANYRNGEDYTYTISPSGASAVTLSFTAFDIESNYDFLKIYDGPSTASPLIGNYTGTNSPGTVTSTGGSLTLRFTSDTWTTRDGWEANWTCATNTAPSTTVNLPGDWFADDFVTSFTDIDNTGSVGIDSRFYQVLEFDGTEWGCNRNNGFLFETFDNGSFPNWTTQTGNWYLLNNRIHQTDSVETNTNVYIDVDQDNSGSWMYSFSARLWNSIASQNRRFGIHIFADAPGSTNRGNSYLIWFRQDNQTMEIYETENNVLNRQLVVPLTTNSFVWYDFRITYDPSTGEIKVWRDGVMVGSWIDPTPIQAGGYVSLRCNQSHLDYDDIRVFKERGGSVNVKVGPAATEDVRYQSLDVNTPAGQVFGISLDGNEVWSNMDFRNFYVDWTPPTDVALVEDGTGSDVDTVPVVNELSANWGTAVDTNSAILRYWVAVGTTSGGTDVLGWTDNGDSTDLTLGVSLVHGTMYYVSVKAENLSGLESGVVTSDGQLYYNLTSGGGELGLEGLQVYPNPAEDFVVVELVGGELAGVEVVDLWGRALMKIRGMNSTTMNVDLRELVPGVYLLRITRADGAFGVVRLVAK